MATWDSTGEYKYPLKDLQQFMAQRPGEYGQPGEALAPHEYIRRLKGAGITDLPPGPADLGSAAPRYFSDVNQFWAGGGAAPPFDAAEQERWAAEFAKPGKRKEPSLAMKAVLAQFGGDMGAYNQWHGAKPPSLQKRIDSWPKALAQLKRERAAPAEEELVGPPTELFGPPPGGGGASWGEEEFVGPPTELFGPTPVAELPPLRGSRQARGLPPREVTPGPEGPRKWALGGRRDDFGRAGMYTEGRFEFPQAPPAPGLLPSGGRSAREVMDAGGDWIAQGRPARTPEQKLAFDEGKYVSPQRSATDTIAAYRDWEAGKMTPYATGGTIEGIPEELQRPGFSPERSPREIMDTYAEWAKPEQLGAQQPIGQPPAHTGPAVGRFEFPQKTTMHFADDVMTGGGALDFGGMESPLDFAGAGAGIPPMTIGPDQMDLPPVDLSRGVPRGGPYGQPQLLGDVQGPGLGDIRFQEPRLQGPGLGDISFPGETGSISPDPNSLLWQQYNTARQGLQAEDLAQRKVMPKTLSEINQGAVMASPLSPLQGAGQSGDSSPYLRGFGPGFSGEPLQALNQREMLRKRRANEKFSRIAKGQ